MPLDPSGRLSTRELKQLRTLGWNVESEQAERDPYKADRTGVDLGDGLGKRGDPVLPIRKSLVDAGVAVPLPQE